MNLIQFSSRLNLKKKTFVNILYKQTNNDINNKYIQ